MKNWIWTFWRRPRRDGEPSAGMKDAVARLNEAKRNREESERLIERHRRVRAKNHLGLAAEQSMKKKGRPA